MARKHAEPAPEPEGGGLAQPSLWLGLLAAAPLFVAYEWGLAETGTTTGRNAAELLLTRALAGFGTLETPLRWLLVAALVLVAFARLRLDQRPIARPLVLTGLEALAAAVVLGPLLYALVSLCDVTPLPVQLGASEILPGPSLATAARLMGGAVWEELAFRVLAYGLVYLLFARLLAFFGLARRASHLGADLAAILGSAGLFAVFHLELVTGWFGEGGEPYDGAVFLWRLVAGILLAGLYRWRGLGVVAWAHGLFNLSLLLGADPSALR